MNAADCRALLERMCDRWPETAPARDEANLFHDEAGQWWLDHLQKLPLLVGTHAVTALERHCTDFPTALEFQEACRAAWDATSDEAIALTKDPPKPQPGAPPHAALAHIAEARRRIAEGNPPDEEPNGDSDFPPETHREAS